jgi:dihydrofolate reductase
MSNTKFSVFISISLDGYIAGENGELDWLSIVQQEGEDYGFQSYFDSVDTVLIGRNTYEVMKQFDPWPMS